MLQTTAAMLFKTGIAAIMSKKNLVQNDTIIIVCGKLEQRQGCNESR